MKKYSIIYADPPWQYPPRRNIHTKFGGGAMKHYSVLSIGEIKKLPIKDITAKNCALFLWCTSPLLVKQVEVIATWGFRYVTVAFFWLKTYPKSGKIIYIGTGHYTRSNCEICLLGIKGRMIRRNNKVSQVVIAPRQAHSVKPNEVRSRIVNLFGNLSRIELFAREKVKGWDVWGNEVKNNIEFNITSERRKQK